MKFKSISVTLSNERVVTIRQAVVTDASALLETGALYLQESPYLISTLNEFNFTKQEEQQWIRSLNDSENSLLLVATAENRIIGSVNLRGEPRKKVRHNVTLGIAILKKWHHLGLGTALLQAVIEWAAAHPYISTIWLDVHATNEVAQGLYKKTGFNTVAIKKDFINELDGRYTDNIIMMRKVKQH